MTFNKFSTHSVASISFLKYISAGLTLHSTAKQRIINALMNANLTENGITTLQECASTNTTSNSNNKRNPDGNRKDPTENSNAIVFPAFDLSTKRVGFGNGTVHITTVAYKIRCHPDDATLLKSILIQASILDPLSPSDNHFRFIPRGIIQTIDTSTIKTKLFNTTDSLLKLE